MAVAMDVGVQSFLTRLEEQVRGARSASLSDRPQDTGADFAYWIAALKLVEDERQRLKASGWYRHPRLVEYRLALAMSEVQMRKAIDEYLGLGEEVDWAAAFQSVEATMNAARRILDLRTPIAAS